MTQPVSKRQLRMLQAIIHGKHGTTARGDHGPPKSVAEKYTTDGDGKICLRVRVKSHSGGRWGDKKLKKALEEYLIKSNKQAAGCIIVNPTGQILLGKKASTGKWTNPGGHVEEGETFAEAALRETKEEATLTCTLGRELCHEHSDGYDGKTFLVESFRGKPKSDGELIKLSWHYPHEIPWKKLSTHTYNALKVLMMDSLAKSRHISWLAAEENLSKNIIRSGSAPSDVVYELTHGDALKVVGNGAFRFLRNVVKDMTDEDFKEVSFDQYTIHIRKHVNDVYSGRIVDGHKQIHQFTNKSLPAVAAELMSVFEWYTPEDEHELHIMNDDELSDDAIHGGMNSLVDHYRKHNIVNIYTEMENIRKRCAVVWQ